MNLIKFLLITLMLNNPSYSQYNKLLNSVNGNNQLGIDFLKANKDYSKNYVVSPYGISKTTLGLYRASVGKTFMQIHKTMHYGNQNQVLSDYSLLNLELKSQYTVETSNQSDIVYWIEKVKLTLKKYEEFLDNYLKVDKISLTFKDSDPKYHEFQSELPAVEKMNFSHKKNLQFVVTNRNKFEGHWAEPFDPENTSMSDFFLMDGTRLKTDFMHTSSFIRYNQNEDLELFDIPYSGDNFSLLIIYPKKVDGLKAIEESLNPVLYNFYYTSLYEQPIDLYLPKFKISTTGSVKPTLTELGMSEVFDKKAQLQGMSLEKTLYLNDLIITDEIEVSECVDEDNTFYSQSYYDYNSEKILGLYKEKRLDHPFLFIIKDNHTGLILYIGRVVNPKE